MPESPFDTLLAVQDLDTLISQLHHRKASLAERAELDALHARAAELERAVTGAEARRSDLLARQAELESRITAFDERRRAVEQRLYADRGSASRDLQAMNDEIHHLALRRSELEDAELALMEEQEPIDAELTLLTGQRTEVSAAAAEQGAALAAAESVVDAELETAIPERARVAAGLPPDLAEHYERLRARLKGTGAARLVGNHCDGCHLELPSVEVDRIRHLAPDEVVTCDQCGRILIRASSAG